MQNQRISSIPYPTPFAYLEICNLSVKLSLLCVKQFYIYCFRCSISYIVHYKVVSETDKTKYCKNSKRFESIREDIIFTCQMYVMVIGFTSLFLSNKLINKMCLLLLFILFITDTIVSKIYFNHYLAAFAGVFDGYDTNLGVFKILLTTLVLFLILRKIFILLTGEEPIIVMERGFTSNYIFTVLVLVGGIVLSYLIPWS